MVNNCMGIYKPPSVNDADFSEKFSKNIDKIIVKYENYIVFSDINFDILNENKSQPLNDICDIFDLDQLVKEPTCFKKDCVPSLVDVVLTNKKSSCFNTLNLPTGVSDCHNLTSTTIKGHLSAQQRSKITYWSYRTFDIDKFNNEIDQIKMENLDSVISAEQVNETYQKYESEFINVLNNHAPLKSRYPRRKRLPCMNGELRKAIYRKHMLYSQYTKNRNNQTWEKFRGTYKVRNEIETKRNQRKRNETKRNQQNENEIKRNQRKQNEIKENKTK